MAKAPKVAKFKTTEVIQQFKALDQAVIDACSMIYLNKLQLLPLLAKQIQLFTPQLIFEETGFGEQKGIIVKESPNFSLPDKQLMAMALQLNLPLISDDGQVLKVAQKMKLTYFNSLMMVIFLYFKKEINFSTLQQKKVQLLNLAYYAPWIARAGEQLITELSQ